MIKKLNGDPCKNVEESVSRWQEHFCQILNTQSRFNMGTISSVQSMAVREDLGLPPSEDEILQALNALKGGKAGGKNAGVDLGFRKGGLKKCAHKRAEFFSSATPITRHTH